MWSMLGGLIVRVLGSGIVGPVLAHLDKRTDADLERYKTAMAAELEANRQRAVMAGSFRPLVYAIALPFIVHLWAVAIDTVPWFGRVGSWGVPPLPEPFQSWEAAILTSFFVLSPVASVAKGIAARLAR